MFTIDGSKLQAAFTIDESALTAGMSGLSLDLSGLSLDASALPAFDASGIAVDPGSIDLGSMIDFSDITLDMGEVQPDLDSEKIQAAMAEVMGGFDAWYDEWVAQGNEPDMEAALEAYLATTRCRRRWSPPSRNPSTWTKPPPPCNPSCSSSFPRRCSRPCPPWPKRCKEHAI